MATKKDKGNPHIHDPHKQRMAALHARLKEAQMGARVAFEHGRPVLPFLAKTGAIGVVGYAGLNAGRRLIETAKTPGVTPEERITVTGEGTFVETPGGGSAFIPNMDYLAALAAAGGPGATDVPDFPFILDAPATPAEEVAEEVVGKLFSPMTLLVVGGVILAVIYLRRKK